VGRAEVADLLRAGNVAFVAASVGLPMRWIATADLFTFWKNQVKPHLVDKDATFISREAYPKEYCYLPTYRKSARVLT
jgi:hypothetical protein